MAPARQRREYPMSGIVRRAIRLAQILTLVLTLAVCLGGGVPVAAAALDRSTPAAVLAGIRDDDARDEEEGGEEDDEQDDDACADLGPWVNETTGYILEVAELYESMNEALQTWDPAWLAEIEALADGIGDIVDEMEDADVPDSAEALHEELVDRLDDVAWAYQDFADAANRMDTAAARGLSQEIVELDQDLVKAINDYEDFIEECGYDLNDDRERD
jgi:hypothetical protein